MNGVFAMARIFSRSSIASGIWAIIAIIWLMMIAPFAAGQLPSNQAEAGRRLGEEFCAQCHVVVPRGQAGWTDAPAFKAIASRPEATIGWLSAFIEKPHMDMLNTGRPPAEADAIATYILSLRRD